MAANLKIRVERTENVQFVSTNAAGAKIVMDGPADMGGKDAGLRPMETLLSALAGCSAIDVIHIMGKQRQDLQGLAVEVEGERADAVPAVFTKIHLRFIGGGPIDLAKFQKAVELSMEKYCSVSHMLQPKAQITAEAVLA